MKSPHGNLAVVVKTVLGSHVEVGAPPILEPILVVGLNPMFTEDTFWILTHGNLRHIEAPWPGSMGL